MHRIRPSWASPIAELEFLFKLREGQTFEQVAIQRVDCLGYFHLAAITGDVMNHYFWVKGSEKKSLQASSGECGAI